MSIISTKQLVQHLNDLRIVRTKERNGDNLVTYNALVVINTRGNGVNLLGQEQHIVRNRDGQKTNWRIAFSGEDMEINLKNCEIGTKLVHVHDSEHISEEWCVDKIAIKIKENEWRVYPDC